MNINNIYSDNSHLNMQPATEYFQTLKDYGFTFEDFSEEYPNLAKSEYGQALKALFEEEITLNNLVKDLTVKRAEEIAGKVQPRNTKIDGSVFNFPTSRCITGAKLAKIGNSVCASCYATAIENGRNGGTVLKSVNRNIGLFDLMLDAYERGDNAAFLLYIASLAKQIKNISKNKRKAGRVGVGLHRWLASGDIPHYLFLIICVKIAQLLPHINFWLPTKEAGFINCYLSEHGKFPLNLNVRLSDSMIDQPVSASRMISTDRGYTFSSVANKTKIDGIQCPVSFNKDVKSCGDCEACYNPKIQRIVYKLH